MTKVLNEAKCLRPRTTQRSNLETEVEAEAKFKEAEQNSVLIEYLT